MNKPARMIANGLVMLMIGAFAVLTPNPAPGATAPFDALDNIEGDQIDLLFMPVDPMVLSADAETLWAVNTHGSTVVGFNLATGALAKTFDVPWGPVSIEYFTSPTDGHEELLVTTRGTYGLVRLDPSTGDLLGFLELPAEPADLLVDASNGHVFVACSAQDVVLEINAQNAIHDRYEIDTSRHLLFLSSDGAGNVLVAPMLSGNNSLAQFGGQIGQPQSNLLTSVLDTADPAVAVIGLPDHDLFRLVPGAAPFTGTVEVAATALGTHLFAHGRNPASGDLWMLNTEANNKDPDRQSEPAIRGEVVFNRLTITTLDPLGTVGAADHTVVMLDDSVPSTSEIDYLPGYSVGQPYDLAFADDGGAIVVGMLSDNAVELDASGGRIRQFAVADGAIPRDVLLVGDTAYIYAWGLNKILCHDLTNPATPEIRRLPLGYDPTPAAIRAGRKIFYDGKNSLHGNASCNSCHPDVGMDFLVWNVSDWPVDDKGPMVTQTLRGIEELLPYHWRGERSFLDFNPAFDGLLGGTPLSEEPGGAFDLFQKFVFHVRNPANPFAHPERIVSDDADRYGFNVAGVELHENLSAVAGQDIYFTEPTVGPATCNECHTLPTGTVNDFFHDGLADQDHRSSFDVPAYNALWRKEQKARVTVQFQPEVPGSTVQVRAPLGPGTSHAGNRAGVMEFVTEQFPSLTVGERQDVAFFLHQIDSGLAPAVHRARLLSGTGAAATEAIQFIEDLLTQARFGNCSVAVFGKVSTSEGDKQVRWYWNQEILRFVPEDPSLPPRRLPYFVNQAAAGNTNLFLGLPVGMARRWAVDNDNDGLLNGAEVSASTNPFSPDSDRDGFLDGTEVTYGSNPLDNQSQPTDPDPPVIEKVRLIYVTAQVAKLIIETSEPARVEVDYATGSDPVSTVVSAGWKYLHTIFLRDLKKSYVTKSIFHLYSGEVRAFDQTGNPAVAKPLPSFQTESFIVATEQNDPENPITETILDELAWVDTEQPAGGGYKLTYTARAVHQKDTYPTPLVDHVAVARVLVKKAGSDEFVRESNFTIEGAAFTPIAFLDPLGGLFAAGGPFFYAGLGPFLFSTRSNANGYCTLEFTLPDADAGDQVRVSIETVMAVDPMTWDPNTWSATVFPGFLGISVWHFPATATENRATDPVTLP